jgi:DNA invertase Pin-like site-specific DNA recombinase
MTHFDYNDYTLNVRLLMSSEVRMPAETPRFVSYIRVSTAGQHLSGLGEDAQRVAVDSYVRSKNGKLLEEVQETQSGRKGLADRPQLARALALCKKSDAALVIGKLDRLARDVRHFLALVDDSGVDIRFADLPDICPRSDEGRMLLVNMANFAEFEARRIGTRTRAALAAAKARGVLLGTAGPSNLRPNIDARKRAADAFAQRLYPVLEGFRAQRLSQRAQVDQLNALGIRTARGGTWSLVQLQRTLSRTKTSGCKSEAVADAYSATTPRQARGLT